MLRALARTIVAASMTAALFACGSDSTSPSVPATAAVTATSGFAYAPDTVTVSRNGGTVTFTFQTRMHSVTWLSEPSGAAVDSIPASSNTSVARTFEKAGTYNYHCSIHPSMTGTVIIQ